MLMYIKSKGDKMVITSNDSVKLEELYEKMNSHMQIEKNEIKIEGRGALLELLTNEDFLHAVIEISKYTYLSYVAYLEYKKDGKTLREKIDDEILVDPITPENVEKIEDMTKDKEEAGLYIEFKK